MPELDDVAQRVEVYVWERDTEPGREGYLKLVRTKTVREVYEELRAILGEFPDGGEEYFSVCIERGGDEPWPSGRIVAYSVNGSSEGDYTHIDVMEGNKRHALMLGKTFMGRDASWAFARRLADMLEWQ